MKKIFKIQILRAILIALILFSLFASIFSDKDSYQSSLEFSTHVPELNYIFKKLAYISGEIANPGVYEIDQDTRVIDLIDLAGGLTENADNNAISTTINLAKKVNDEEKIYLPAIGSTTNSTKINLNSATIKELEKLPGIGPVSAANLANLRPIVSLSDLLKIKGFNEAKILALKDLVSL